MADDYSVTAVAVKLTDRDITSCLAILEQGKAVNTESAARELRRATDVVIARYGDTPVGVGAIKRQRPRYAADKAHQSGVPFDPAMAEIGYVAVDVNRQGHGISNRIVTKLLSQHTASLFATTSNERMKRVLRSAGFERRGREWDGEHGRLSLWIRNAQRRDLVAEMKLRGWLDYDRPALPQLRPAQRIDYFEWRVRRVVINPLERILATEIQPTDDSSALLIFGVSLCCAIEATSEFLQRNGGLLPFLKRYMSPEYQKRYLGKRTFGDVLRTHFRNGLAHGFSIRHGGFEGASGQNYFKIEPICGIDSLELNPFAFFDDYAVGFERYLADVLRAKPTSAVYKAFHQAFESIFINGE
jgi:RimJ/RimL family protein N-acetyltransferase